MTFDEWDACVKGGKCDVAEDEGWGRGKRPVINVTWTDADRYTKWLAEKTGKPYRLLTEAEWEYAARAGAGRARFFGIKREDVCTYANLYDRTAEAKLEFGMETLPCDDGYDVTAPVGSFKPNAFGLHDMLGNVWEWTEDCQVRLWRNAPTDARARVTGPAGSSKWTVCPTCWASRSSPTRVSASGLHVRCHDARHRLLSHLPAFVVTVRAARSCAGAPRARQRIS